MRQPRINAYLDINYHRIASRFFPQSYFGLLAQLWRDGSTTEFFAELELQLGRIEALRFLSLDNAAVWLGPATSVVVSNIDDRTTQLELQQGVLDLRVRRMYQQQVVE